MKLYPNVNVSSILSGISKTLSIANQAIPLYRQVSPMIKNAKNVYSVVKDLGKNKSFNLKRSNYQTNNINNNFEPEKKEVVYNNPVFFQ